MAHVNLNPMNNQLQPQAPAGDIGFGSLAKLSGITTIASLGADLVTSGVHHLLGQSRVKFLEDEAAKMGAPKSIALGVGGPPTSQIVSQSQLRTTHGPGAGNPGYIGSNFQNAYNYGIL